MCWNRLPRYYGFVFAVPAFDLPMVDQSNLLLVWANDSSTLVLAFEVPPQSSLTTNIMSSSSCTQAHIGMCWNVLCKSEALHGLLNAIGCAMDSLLSSQGCLH